MEHVISIGQNRETRKFVYENLKEKDNFNTRV